MVRPNQIIKSGDNELTFLMFARSENAVKRRVLFINFPPKVVDVVLGDETVDQHISNVELATEGRVNRYKVTVDTAGL